MNRIGSDLKWTFIVNFEGNYLEDEAFVKMPSSRW